MGEGGGKRKAEGGGGGGKKRSYFSGKTSDKTIPAGVRGVLVSAVAGKEAQAGREAITLLTEAYEKLCPDKAAAPAAPPPGGDIAAALASEVAALKSREGAVFAAHASGLNSVVFVEYRDAEGPSPTALAVAIAEEVKATQVNRTRFCCRLHPVEYQCYANMEKIDELAEKVVAAHFPCGEGAKPRTFAVQYEHRASPQLDRMAVIDAFAKRIPAPHKVNLGAPQLTILVNLVKSTCAVAVIPQFRELMRLNLRMLAGELDEDSKKGGKGGNKGRLGAKSVGAATGERPEQQQQLGEEGKGEEDAAAATAAGEQKGEEQQEQQLAEGGGKDEGGTGEAAAQEPAS